MVEIPTGEAEELISAILNIFPPLEGWHADTVAVFVVWNLDQDPDQVALTFMATPPEQTQQVIDAIREIPDVPT